jgi:toxin-antitoxin system PIN domain toxin
MGLVDTNILVYAAERTFPEHEAARDFVERRRRSHEPWHVTWGILYEFLRVVTHPRVFARPWRAAEAFRFLEAVLASPAISILAPGSAHEQILAETLGAMPDLAGNLIHDSATAVLMREHGIRRIYTRDTDFHRFRFLEVVDPLAEGKTAAS